MGKYRNKKICLDGIYFDSKKEARRYVVLKRYEKEGKIKDLKCQVEFPLLPAQYEPSTEVYQRGEHKGEPKQGKLIERAVVYIADFTYTTDDGQYIVEDVKGGVKTKEYILKRKMILYFHNIRIREV